MTASTPRCCAGHLVAFLEEVVPTAERLGLRLCCHPDDPPFPLLGLPRIMSTEEDYRPDFLRPSTARQAASPCARARSAHGPTTICRA